MICQRCAKEKPGIHTCTPSDLVRELEQQRDELVSALLTCKYQPATGAGAYASYYFDKVKVKTALAKVKK